jgi:MFS family permease
VQGWIQSVLNGSSQTLPEYFKLKNDIPATEIRPANYEWVSRAAIYKFGAVNAIVSLTAALFGCWISDPLQSRFLGRRGAIFASGLLCIIASIGAATVSRHWWHLLIWRGILGLGLGAKASVTPIFAAEISPAHLRGKLVMNWQLMVALGLFCGFSANLIFYWTDELAWRCQIASAAIPAFALVLLIWTIPESPRWLLKQNKGPQAFKAMCRLRHTPLQAATELFFANAQLQEELKYIRRHEADLEGATSGAHLSMSESDQDAGTRDAIDLKKLGEFKWYHNAVQESSYWGRIIQLFSNDRTRRAAVAACIVMIGQQLCGV